MGRIINLLNTKQNFILKKKLLTTSIAQQKIPDNFIKINNNYYFAFQA